MRAKLAAMTQLAPAALMQIGGVLPRGAAAEVGAGHDDIPRLHSGYEIRVGALQAVLGQLRRVGEGEIGAGDDYICIHIGPVFMDFAFKFQDICSFS
jgi:hypothetical protein